MCRSTSNGITTACASPHNARRQRHRDARQRCPGGGSVPGAAAHRRGDRPQPPLAINVSDAQRRVPRIGAQAETSRAASSECPPRSSKKSASGRAAAGEELFERA